ncbi:hypothetical protein CEE37_03620 [candidate division LCP-89 bacterium B3_LCP]|uniref:Right handed beta helix domain-containing protein n=1 Tax=candidate division LCP-89 bacterium B3_LCP TaxID=2012998 RepID=A0A532V3V0_UNCL8|nr:MAG: hypothetical protein CEE37_03620 [candidate division LCP-89 bacterium B3_LCP]
MNAGKHYAFIIAFAVTLIVTAVSAQTIIPGGDVSGTWEAVGSPYLIEGEITVPADSILNIEPGVEVNFQGHYKFNVNGFLEAVGTETDSILFTAADPDTGWHGIRFIGAPDSSHLSYCIVQYGYASGNFPDFSGGGINCSSSNPVIKHCTFRENSAVHAGGGIYCAYSNPVISYCSITENVLELYGAQGGGIAIKYSSNPDINHCTISQNSATNGGGIQISNSYPLISYTTINENAALFGGGVNCGSGGNAIFSHCVISRNTTELMGGGMSVTSTCPTIVNTVFESNYGDGGINFYYPITPYITYSDFYNNENGAFTYLGAPIPELGSLVTVNANGDSCDIFCNIFEDPLFENPNNGNFQITWDNYPYWDETRSPCIDAGDPASPLDPDNTIADIGVFYFDQVSTGTLILGGDVYGNWEASGSPYFVEGEITVPADETLTIGPGVYVIFQGHYKLIVNGYLEAAGAEGDSILFTAADTSEGWHGIRFIEAPDSSHLSYCIIEYGRAFGDSLDHHGGGIMCESSSPVIGHCTISRNSSDENGGGIYCTANESSSCPTIHQCSISGNTAAVFGGGISCDGWMFATEPNISQCDIIGNTATTGGGISLIFYWPTISFCTINNNTATTGSGGGIYSLSSVPFLDHCTFNGNSTGGSGGAIASYWCGDFVADHCVFSENTSGSDGGAVWVDYNTWPSFLNCTISNNSSGENGGGIYVGSMCCLYNFRNTIVSCNQGNGAIYFRNVDVCTITYSDFSDNEFGNFLGGSVPAGLGQLVTVNTNGDSCDAFYNIFLDPCLVNVIQNDFRLQWGSPCIDAGDPDPSYNDPDGTAADIGTFYFDQSMPVRVLLTPFDMPIEIAATGGSFDYYVQVTNIAPLALNVDAWCDVTMPDGSVFGPTLGPVNIDIGSEVTIGRERTQNVPPAAPVGTYTYNAYATAGTDTSMDSFSFIKLGSSGMDWLSGWFNTGESFSTAKDSPVTSSSLPSAYSLGQNYPNPFNPTTVLSFSMRVASLAKLTVFDISGRMVAELVDGWRDEGVHEAVFDGSGLASGVYLYRLIAGEFTDTGKMVLMK